MLKLNVTVTCDTPGCESWAPATMYLAATWRHSAPRLDKMSLPEGWLIRPDPNDHINARLQAFCPAHHPVG